MLYFNTNVGATLTPTGTPTGLYLRGLPCTGPLGAPADTAPCEALCGRRNGAIGQHSTAGAAGKGVSNVAEVQKALHRGGGSPTLSVP